VAVIVSGLVLLVQGETKFNTTGFLLVMSASCMSGLRFTLTQVLLHGKHGTSDLGERHSSSSSSSRTASCGTAAQADR
jgi:solute carrier family 35 protein C2